MKGCAAIGEGKNLKPSAFNKKTQPTKFVGKVAHQVINNILAKREDIVEGPVKHQA